MSQYADEAKTACGRKRKLTKNHAAKEARRLGQRRYLCPMCRGWHLTSQDRGERRERF